MIEEKDFEEIMQELLSYVPDNVDKRESSVIYQALAPVAMYLQNVYSDLKYVWDGIFIEGLSGTDLDAKVAERALTRKEATATVVMAHYTPSSVEFAGSERFSIPGENGEIIWFCIADSGELYGTEDGEILLVCEEDGEIGNIPEGNLLPDTTVQGLERIYIYQILEYGKEEETDEELRQRYYDSFDTQKFGGNIASYEEWMMEQDGVAACKIIPFWVGIEKTKVLCNGGHAIAGGTVGIYFLATGYRKPSDALVAEIQNAIDPPMYTGEGRGLAPIGHVVTVIAVDEEPLTITTQLEIENGYTFEDIKAELEKAFDEYLTELSSQWGEKTIVVRISEIESRLLALEDVIDIKNTKINGEEENYKVSEFAIPVREAIVDGN